MPWSVGMLGGGAGASSITLNTVSSLNLTTDPAPTGTTTLTYSGVSIGTAPAGSNRRYCICVLCYDVNTFSNDFGFSTPTSLTIGGVSSTEVQVVRTVRGSRRNPDVLIGYSEVSSGTTADVSVSTFSSGSGLIRFMTGRLFSVETGTSGITVAESNGQKIETTSTSKSLSYNYTSSNDGDFIVFGGTDAGSPNTLTWANATATYDTQIGYALGGGNDTITFASTDADYLAIAGAVFAHA